MNARLRLWWHRTWFAHIFTDSRHPLVVATLIALASTLAVPFSTRYGEVQRKLALRQETAEELVQYSATVQNTFRAIDQMGQQLMLHPMKGAELRAVEDRIQEHTNRMLTAQHVLDAHIAFRFHNPEVRRRYNIQRDSVRITLNALVSFNLKKTERDQALKEFWESDMGNLNQILAAMSEDMYPSGFRVYRFVFFGSLGHHPHKGEGIGTLETN